MIPEVVKCTECGMVFPVEMMEGMVDELEKHIIECVGEGYDYHKYLEPADEPSTEVDIII